MAMSAGCACAKELNFFSAAFPSTQDFLSVAPPFSCCCSLLRHHSHPPGGHRATLGGGVSHAGAAAGAYRTPCAPSAPKTQPAAALQVRQQLGLLHDGRRAHVPGRFLELRHEAGGPRQVHLLAVDTHRGRRDRRRRRRAVYGGKGATSQSDARLLCRLQQGELLQKFVVVLSPPGTSSSASGKFSAWVRGRIELGHPRVEAGVGREDQEREPPVQHHRAHGLRHSRRGPPSTAPKPASR